MFKYSWVWNKETVKGHLLAKNKPLNITEDICSFYKTQSQLLTLIMKNRPESNFGKTQKNLRTKRCNLEIVME
jgi:hypothetical protein